MPAGANAAKPTNNPTGTVSRLIFGMTQEPEKTEPDEPTEKAPQRRRDLPDWYPYLLLREGGKTAAVVAALMEVSVSRVNARAGEWRAMGAAKREKIREAALRRRRLEAETEYLIGDPAKAVKLANAYTALRRAEREERIAQMETRNAATPGENKEAKLSDAEVELLRADLRRRYIPELPARAEGSDAGSGDGKSAARTRE
tara:strand:+ start:124392 stop:124994 length:603 start_codon:yes stop_codon:yes gene_type:complete